ncbi:GAF domain-containing protein [Croceibacterium ferulae]|uniref:GAF domain-containing protein n=1 Tax=Croceibacterium ferulae TaxID=1854641 RepID=UPI000EAD03A1|nr:GAF domain-containing protein [Croceibacterium ferulae]
MGHIAHSQDFDAAHTLAGVDALRLDNLHSLGDLTRFLQNYLDCELALVSLPGTAGAWTVRAGIDMPVPVGTGDPGGLADPIAARACGMQFFAGLPLRDGAGRCIGTMAAMDGAERPLSGEELGVLRQLAGVAAGLCMPETHD